MVKALSNVEEAFKQIQPLTIEEKLKIPCKVLNRLFHIQGMAISEDKYFIVRNGYEHFYFYIYDRNSGYEKDNAIIYDNYKQVEREAPIKNKNMIYNHPGTIQIADSFLVYSLQRQRDEYKGVLSRIMDFGNNRDSIRELHNDDDAPNHGNALIGIVCVEERNDCLRYIVIQSEMGHEIVCGKYGNQNTKVSHFKIIWKCPGNEQGFNLVVDKQGTVYGITSGGKDDESHIRLYKMVVEQRRQNGEIHSARMEFVAQRSVESKVKDVTCRTGTGIEIVDDSIVLYVTNFAPGGLISDVYATVGKSLPYNNPDYIDGIIPLVAKQDIRYMLSYNYGGSNHLMIYLPDRCSAYICSCEKGKYTPYFKPVYKTNYYDATDQKKLGIGTYNLHSPVDRVIAFDYDHTRRMDHLVCYRPGTQTIFIVKKLDNGQFEPVYKTDAYEKGYTLGIGEYDLKSGADRILAFDYDHSGKMDYLVCYRPGASILHILQHERGNKFKPVYTRNPWISPVVDIGGYVLDSPLDRVMAFDYDHSGKMDHLVCYRPGGIRFAILKHYTKKEERQYGCQFGLVYQRIDDDRNPWNKAIGDFVLADRADRVIAFDCDHVGRMDYLVFYRPGASEMQIVCNTQNTFITVFKLGGNLYKIDGLKRMLLSDINDRVIAFDYDGSGKLDYLLFYNKVKRGICILDHIGNKKYGADSEFRVVYDGRE